MNNPWENIEPPPTPEPATITPATPVHAPLMPTGAEQLSPADVLREGLTNTHITHMRDGAHDVALQLLRDVSEGNLKDERITRDGDVVEINVPAVTRVMAAGKLWSLASKLTNKPQPTQHVHVNAGNLFNLALGGPEQ